MRDASGLRFPCDFQRFRSVNSSEPLLKFGEKCEECAEQIRLQASNYLLDATKLEVMREDLLRAIQYLQSTNQDTRSKI